jgi:hypothetical protein
MPERFPATERAPAIERPSSPPSGQVDAAPGGRLDPIMPASRTLDPQPVSVAMVVAPSAMPVAGPVAAGAQPPPPHATEPPPASEVPGPLTNGAVHPVAPRGAEADGPPGCTAAQLRRFIKSRAYIPLHELRRRFELVGSEEDVNPLVVDGRCLFVGLPPREATLLGELLGAGDVGFELLLDPASPLIVGVFPMRPVPRS